MNEKKAKELTDSIFNKLNDQERVYLAWIHNQKNKEIQELKEENEFLKLSNPEMNIEHSRYVKENKRKIDNLRLVNERLNNELAELKSQLQQKENIRKEIREYIEKEREKMKNHQYAVGIRRLNKIENILDKENKQ